MPKTFEIEGVGTYEFPDDATESEVLEFSQGIAGEAEPLPPNRGMISGGQISPPPIISTPEVLPPANGMISDGRRSEYDYLPPLPKITAEQLAEQPPTPGMFERFNQLFEPPPPSNQPPTDALPPKDQAILDEAVNRLLLKERIARVESPFSHGTRESVAEGVRAITSPAGLATAGAAAVAPEVVIPALFAKTLTDVPEVIERIQKAREEKDRPAYYKAITDAAQTGAVLAGTGAYVNRLPRSLNAWREGVAGRAEARFERAKDITPRPPLQIADKGIPPTPKQPTPEAHALQKQISGGAVPTLPPQPVQGEQAMPAETGVARIRGGEQAPEKPQVPLSPTDAIRDKLARGEEVTREEIAELLGEAPKPPVQPAEAPPPAEPVAPNVFYDEAVKAYTATVFHEKFGNMHGTGNTPESAIAALNKHIEDAGKYGTWRSAEHPAEAAKPTAPPAEAPKPAVPPEAKAAAPAEPAAKPVAPEAKQPWQMTRDEFAKEKEPDYPTTYKIELEAVAGGEKPAHYGFYPTGKPWAAEVYQRAKQLGLYIKKGPRKNDYIITRDTESGRARANTIYTIAKDAVRDETLLDDVTWHDRFAKLLGYGPEFEGRIQAISGPTALENKRLHRHFVWQALREGKPVPPEVLADYPDLAPKAAPEPAAPAKTPPAAAAKAQAKAEAEKVQKYAREMVPSAGNYIKRSIDAGATPKQAALQWAKEIGDGMADVPDAVYKKERGGLYTSTYVKGVFGTKEGVAINAGEYLKAIDAARIDTQKRFGPKPAPPAEPPTGEGTVGFFPRRSEAQGLGEQAMPPTVEDVRAQRLSEDKKYLRDLRRHPDSYMEFDADPIVDEVAQAASDLVANVKKRSQKKSGTYNAKETEEGVIAISRMMEGKATEADRVAAARFLDPTSDAVAAEIEMEFTSLGFADAKNLTAEKVLDFAADYAGSAYGISKDAALKLMDHKQAETIAKLVREEAAKQYPDAAIKLGEQMAALSKDIAAREVQTPGGVRPFFPRRSEAQGLGEPSMPPTVEDVRRQRQMDREGTPVAPAPGAMSAGELAPERPFTTSVKNAVTAEKRATRGMPPVEEEARRAWGTIWDDVKQKVADDPGAGARLVAELKSNPRPLFDEEVALLLHEEISLEEQMNRVVRQMLDAAETGGDTAISDYRAHRDIISDQLLDLYDVAKSAGREQARGLNARKMIADQNYTLIKMEMAKRAANEGRPLTDEEHAEIKKLHDEIAAAQKAHDEYVAKAEAKQRELELQHAADELKIAAAREAKADTASGTERDLPAERDSIIEGLGKRSNDALIDLRPWIRKLALNFVRSGITERDPLVTAVHDVLKEIFPEIERRDTMDAISGYGDFRALDPEAAKAKLRDLSGQMQNVSKLEDLLARRALQKTGPERKVPSDEERRLIKLVNEYKRRYGVVVTDPATQLKSALAAVKTRLANQIKDLEFQIGTRKKIVKAPTKIVYDAEAQALVIQRDALKAQFDQIFGKPELTDAQRVALATRALERSIAELQRRIAAGETRTGKPISKTPVTPELKALREQQQSLRDQLQELRDADTLLAEERAVVSLQATIADLERRISEGDLFEERRTQAEATAITAPLVERRTVLQRELAELRAKSPEGLARAEAARITAIEKEIVDLEGKIARSELALKNKPARVLSEAEKHRRTVLEQTRAILRDMRERAGLYDPARIANAEKALDRAIAETIRQINEGDLEARKPSPKITSPEIESKRAELEDLRKIRQELKDAATPSKTREEISLSALKTRLRNQILDFNKRLARGDFAIPVRKPVARDPEAVRLERIRDYAKARFQESLQRDRFRQMTLPQKIWQRNKETLDASRSLVTSYDLSALRQGKFIMVAHPIRGAKALPDMLKAAVSEDYAYRMEKEIHNRKNYPLYRQSGLFLAERDTRLSKMEENYASTLAHKIPFFGIGVRASERAFNTFLNRLRADSFDAMAATLSRHSPMTPLEGKVLANFINAATGRGNIGPSAAALNRVFFSPRYVASRFQLILGQPFYKGTGRTRALIAQEYARALIGYAVMYVLYKLALPDSEIETDPRSSDAGKIVVGNTRIDPLAGLQQSTVLLSRLATGETMDISGRVSPIRGEGVPRGRTTGEDVLVRFLRSKLAPVPAAVFNIIAGENVIGEPVTPGSVVQGLTVPLAWQDIKKAIEDQGLTRGAAIAILSIFGEGVQVYDE